MLTCSHKKIIIFPRREMDTQSKGKEKERKIIQKTAPGTKIYVDRSIVGQNSSFVLRLFTHIYVCDIKF